MIRFRCGSGRHGRRPDSPHNTIGSDEILDGVLAGCSAGREAEVDAINKRLASSQCRLLTLLGSGGMGKTRLAVEAAWIIAQQRPGQFLVNCLSHRASGCT